MREEIGAGAGSPEIAGMSSGIAGRTVLLVEDERLLRGLMCEFLERAGYNVLSCAHPDEGIAASLRYPGRIDLLLTDVVMPGMNGREMANRILEHLPEVQVVFMSGYPQHSLAQEALGNGKFEYLQKPFTLKTLSRKLTQLLGNTERVQ
jgi:DNA-binding NtrC family response regulator